MNKNLLIVGAGIYSMVARDIAKEMNCFEKIDFVLNCKMKLELRNWDKGACLFIPIRATAGPLFSIFL